jgi:hypothetical protein
MNAPLTTIPVGVVVERARGASAWSDYLWRAVKVLPGVPDTPMWAELEGDDERALFYAGAADIELFRTETANYRDNLATGAPLLWVVLERSDGAQPYQLRLVTADPAEGEAMTLVGESIVDSVQMPRSIEETIAAFINEHHVEREFVKRQRDRANPEALSRRSGEDMS